MRAMYTAEFHTSLHLEADRSARVVVPLVLEYLTPRSVVDVGCGLGAWLSAFRSRGIDDVTGIDGDYVDRSELAIPVARFRAHDLTAPIAAERTFDLAVSLEVAEHLHESAASTFVRSLTGLGDVVLFSAAVPGQGGTHHVNEQWPAYWAQLFGRQGYVAVDCLRDQLWNRPDVAFWYRQNMMFFVREASLADYPKLHAAGVTPEPRALVHRELYEQQRNERTRWWAAQVNALGLLRAYATNGSRILLAGASDFEPAGLQGLSVLEFCADAGGGDPADGETALEEVLRGLDRGVSHVGFTWQARWYLEHYESMSTYLEANGECVQDAPELTVYRLKTGTED